VGVFAIWMGKHPQYWDVSWMALKRRTPLPVNGYAPFFMRPFLRNDESKVLPSSSFHSNHPFALRPKTYDAAAVGESNTRSFFNLYPFASLEQYLAINLARDNPAVEASYEGTAVNAISEPA
jgi:hypothetical protein